MIAPQAKAPDHSPCCTATTTTTGVSDKPVAAAAAAAGRYYCNQQASHTHPQAHEYVAGGSTQWRCGDDAST